MKNTYYIANWKMNGSKELVDEYIKYSSEYSIPKSSSVILCPPFTLLDYSKNKLPKNYIQFSKITKNLIKFNNFGTNCTTSRCE